MTISKPTDQSISKLLSGNLASLSRRTVNTQSLKCSTCKEKNIAEHSALNGRDTHISPSPQRCRNHGSVVCGKILRARNGGITSVKQSFRMKQGSCTHESTLITTIAQDVHKLQLDKIPAWRGMVDPKTHHQLIRYWYFIASWRGRISFL